MEPAGGRRRVVGALATAVLVLWGPLSGCSVKSPEVPSTNVKISIPVANDTTTIREVVEDRSDYLEFGDDGSMTLNFTTELGADGFAEVGDRLSITPQQAEFTTEIGLIRLPGRQEPPVELELSQLFGQEVPAGTLPLLPASPVDTRVEVPLDEVESLSIVEGELELEVENGLPVALDGLRFELIDLGNGGVVVEGLDLGSVEAGASATGAFDLADKDISGNLAIGVTGTSRQALNVEVAGDEVLEVGLVLSDLVVSEARAVIPSQEISDRQVLEFPDDRIQVTGADISRGGLRLRVRNDIELAMELELSLDELKRPDGEVNVFRIDLLQPGEERIVDFDLDGNRFEPDNPLELRFSYTARTLESGRPVILASDGVIEVIAETEPLFFSRVAGRLNRLELPVESVEDEVDFPDGVDNISLEATDMEVYITSAVGFRSEVTLDITGTNGQGETATLRIDEVFERGAPDNPTQLVIRPDTAELTAFLNLLPISLSVTPTILLGDGVGEEVITDADWVQVDSVRFSSAARFSIDAETRVEPSPQRRELSDDDARERIESNLINALVSTTIENHVPLGVRVRLMVSSNRDEVYTQPELVIPSDGAFAVEAAQVGADGRVSQAVVRERTIELTREEILVFLREGGVYTGVLVEFDATDGKVEVFGSDFVNVQANAQIFIELNEDLVE
jgi:hypothetical protein